MGGKSPEYDVSLASGREIIGNLNPQKYEVLPVVISRDGQQWLIGQKARKLLFKKDQLISQTPPETRKVIGGQKTRQLVPLEQKLPPDVSKQIDVVFIAMHGPYGEDGTIQGMLELAGLRYTGSHVLASALGMDKSMSRKIWQSQKIPVVPAFSLDKNDPHYSLFKNWSYPLVVKPFAQGSSVGVSIVHHKKELPKALNLAFSYESKVIVEKYIKGMEITCGIIGNKDPRALPIVEIIPKHEFFDYACKYTPGLSEEIVPARIDKKTTARIQEMAVAAYKALGCQGFARVDGFLANDGNIYISEINTIPGLTSVSLLPKEAKAIGISYPELLNKIINYALEKNLAQD